MKRLYVIVFLVIAATAALGLAVAQHSGYVLIAYKSFRYEASLWATLAADRGVMAADLGHQGVGRTGHDFQRCGQSMVAPQSQSSCASGDRTWSAGSGRRSLGQCAAAFLSRG